MHRFTNGFLLASSTLAFVIATPALAAPPADDQAEDSAEIIVTAQKREQSLQQVPVAVSAISSEQLAQKQINNLDQLSGLAPNLIITAGNATSSNTQVAVRGTVTTNTGIIYDPAVGMYLDGVYVGKAAGSVFDIGDIERVEVLRGPQGTLFGRNTLAGAVSFITRKPSDKLRLEGEVSYGNYNYMTARGLVNVPLTDALFVKVAGQLQFRDGFSQAVPDKLKTFPTQLGELDNRNRQSLMAQVRWVPTPDLTFDYTYDMSRTKEHPMTALVSVAKGNIFDPASPNYSKLPLYLYQVPGYARPDTISVDQLSQDDSRVYGHAFTAALDLGNATLKSITAYRDVKVDQGLARQELDGTPIPVALAGFTIDYNQFSQELQLSGHAVDKRLNYVVGGYFFRDNGQAINPQKYFFGGNSFYTDLGQRTRAFAAYGQVDFAVTDSLTLTGGVRWTSERKQVNRKYQILALTPNTNNLPLPLTTINITQADNVNRTFSNVSPTAIISYQPSRDINLYAKYSVGFRSGGFNGEAASAVDVRRSFEPEMNKSIEVGLKTRWLDNRLTFNVAAFYDTQVNKQVSVFLAGNTAASLVANAGKARNKGLEFELDFRPNDWIHIYGSLGLLRARYLTYLDTATNQQVVNVADNRVFGHAPRTTAMVGADVQLMDSDTMGRLTLAGDVNYRSYYTALASQRNLDPRFPLVAVADDLFVPKQTLVNARLRWDRIPLGSSGLEGYAMVWGKNLTNNTNVINKISFGPRFGGLVNGNYQDPRTYGFTLGFKY